MYKKVLVSFLLFLAAAFLPVNAFALGAFIKDSNNPLNHNFFLLQSTVKKSGVGYENWFTGHNGSNLKIGYSTSTDGINWPSFVFATLSDSGDNHDPSLFIHNGNSYIYYVSEPAEGSGQNIKLKRSIATGSQFSSPVLINLPRQAWNSQKISCPYGFFENNKYFLFFCGTNGADWNLGLAESHDGINFTPCANNPIVSGNIIGNSQIYTDSNQTKHLLFHTNSGIEQVEATSALSCDTVWSNRSTIISKNKPYDQSQIIAPSIVASENLVELFYTARGPATNNTWRLNRATFASSKPKIIVIPGFFGSWNKEAILHNDSVNYLDWKIPGFIKEYDGLVQTLKNLGLSENDDFYVFPYDWRKPIGETAENLHSFLQTQIWDFEPENPVQLVGHSMGGVIGRIYAQKFNEDKLQKVITIGSPHRGVVQTYSPLEAGETVKDDSLLWLGTKFLININRKGFSTDRQVVREIIPSLIDLFPTYSFLKNRNDELLDISNLSLQNDLLKMYADISGIGSKLTVIYGNKAPNSSPHEIIVGKQALIDSLLTDYQDGRPLKILKSDGDYLVPIASSVLGSNLVEISADHGEVIYTSNSIGKILEALEVQYDPSQLAESSATQLSPSILIAIQSPATISVSIGSETYHEEDGVIFIPNPPSGEVVIHVTKLQPGDYTITIAQIGTEKDVWEEVIGQITESTMNEEDLITINFHAERPKAEISLKKCKKAKKKSGKVYKVVPCLIKQHKVH